MKIDWWNLGWERKSFKGNSGSFWKRRLWILQWRVISDEICAHHHDPENKRQSMEYHHKESPAPKKFKTKASAGKSMFTAFWNSDGMVLTCWPEKVTQCTQKGYNETLKKSQKTHHEKGGRNLLCLPSTRQCQASNKCRHNWCHWKFGVYRLPHPA